MSIRLYHRLSLGPGELERQGWVGAGSIQVRVALRGWDPVYDVFS